MSATPHRATPDPAAPIHDTLARIAAAWNAGDATAFGAEFTADATYVVFDGTVLTGRDEIADLHRWLFDGPLKGSRLVAPSTGADAPVVRFLRPDVAHVLATGGVRPADRQDVTPDRDSVASYVLVRDSDSVRDGWRIAAFQNTRRQAAPR